MARIDYHGIKEAIKDLLEASALFNEPQKVAVVRIEETHDDIEDSPFIGIYTSGADIVAAEQRLAGNTRVDMTPRFEIGISIWHIEGFADAAKERDDILGRVQEVLLLNPTLNGTVGMAYMTGCTVENIKTAEDEYRAIAIVDLETKVHGTT